MSDLTLTPEEQSDLCTLAGMIVPSSDKFVVPGADDPAIFADIVTSITFERDDIKTALNLLSGLAGAARSHCQPGSRSFRNCETRVAPRSTYWPATFYFVTTATTG